MRPNELTALKRRASSYTALAARGLLDPCAAGGTRRIQDLVQDLNDAIAALDAIRNDEAPKRRGATPYGYRRLDGQLVKDLREQTAIAHMKRLRFGKGEGLTFTAIAEWLDDHGYEPPQRAAQWSRESVSNILERESKA